MKKAICLLLMALTSISLAWSQPGPPPSPGGEKRKEKVEALKRSYFSEKLELTPAEAEKFWPIYNEFSKKEDALRKAGKGDKKKGEEPKLSEKEAKLEREFQRELLQHMKDRKEGGKDPKK